MEIIAGITWSLFWVAYFIWLFDEPKSPRKLHTYNGELYISEGRSIYKL